MSRASGIIGDLIVLPDINDVTDLDDTPNMSEMESREADEMAAWPTDIILKQISDAARTVGFPLSVKRARPSIQLTNSEWVGLGD